MGNICSSRPIVIESSKPLNVSNSSPVKTDIVIKHGTSGNNLYNNHKKAPDLGNVKEKRSSLDSIHLNPILQTNGFTTNAHNSKFSYNTSVYNDEGNGNANTLDKRRMTNPNHNQDIKDWAKGQCISEKESIKVYSGLSLITGEIVAIKTFKLNKYQDLNNHIEGINKAVKQLSSLRHRNIVNYITSQKGDAEDEVDVIFEYCNGGSIKQLVEKYDVLEEKVIRIYVKQILEGLVFLHDQNIVHRNIKTTNVLVDGDGIVKLSGFIVSSLLGDDAEEILQHNTNYGKNCPYWIAPEVVMKEKNLTWALDIWSLGCIIIEMATKNPPWYNIAKTPDEVIKLIASSTAPPKFPNHLSKDFKSFMNCCLQKNPENRQSARQLLEHKIFKVNTTPIIKIIDENDNENDAQVKRDSFKLQIDEENKIEKSPSNLNIKDKDEILEKRRLSNKLLENTHNKLLKNVHNFHIVTDKEKETKEKEAEKEKNKLVNILSDKDEGGAFFSVSMSIYSQQSVLPQLQEQFLNNNNNKILPTDITEVEEPENLCSPKLHERPEGHNNLNDYFNFELNPLLNMNSNSKIDIKDTEINNKEEDSVLINNILNNSKFKDFDINNLENLEKFATMEFRKEEFAKLEQFFKDKDKRNNCKLSLGPIEKIEDLLN